MRIFVTILVAVACGAGIGAGAAVLKIRQHPWKGGIGTPPTASGGQVTADEQEFNFGRMDSRENGRHEFTVTNHGDHTLTLNPGLTSCGCTVSEIKDNELAPGQSTTVLVTWQAKKHIGPFKQSVTIVTSDPHRPEVTFTIRGEYTQPVYADPDELTFGQIAGNEPVTRETCILCTLPDQQIEIHRHELSDPSLEKFFQVDCVPLGADELRKDKGVKSGVRVRVTAKPGLPLGRFQPRILLYTNLTPFSEIDIPLFGAVGEVTIVGAGWSSETGILEIGAVDGRSVVERKLIVMARGMNAKDVKFKVVSVEPDFLKVNLGKTTVLGSGMLSQTELLIEIPESKTLGKKVPVNHMGGENGKLGEILLETYYPEIHAVRIRVRFAVGGI